MDVLARTAEAGGHRRDVDDDTAAAAFRCRHALDGFSRAVNGAVHVDLECSCECVIREVGHGRRLADNACIVHQEGNGTERIVAGGKKFSDILRISHIGFHRECLSAQCLAFGNHSVRRLGMRDVVDTDVIAGHGGLARCRRADAAAASCDNRCSRHERTIGHAGGVR